METKNNTQNEVNRETIVNDFSTILKDKMDNKKINAAMDSVMNTDSVAPATLQFGAFSIKITVNEPGGETFTGKTGTPAGPGGGAAFGYVYTNNFSLLYSDTVSFEYSLTPLYASILFFDANSNLLGNFQTGAVSTTIGTGGGLGSWS